MGEHGAPLDASVLTAEPMRSLGLVCAMCNSAHIRVGANGSGWEHTGEPTEGALRTLCEKIGVAGVPEPSEAAPEIASDHWRRTHGLVATLEFST